MAVIYSLPGIDNYIQNISRSLNFKIIRELKYILVKVSEYQQHM